MIGHGCRLGPGCLLAGQVGLGGGTTLGAYVMMGGQAGSAGHLAIGDGAQLAAQTGIHRDIPAGAQYGGSPAMEARRWRRVSASVLRLPEVFRRLRRAEQALGIAESKPEEE
jgi:UDP-3-O-[3-hydroxymyristoyl] glucosamine N-acyltransferase